MPVLETTERKYVQRWMYRCPRKSCRKVRAVDYQVRSVTEICQHPTTGRVIHRAGRWFGMHKDYPTGVKCLCGRDMVGRPVKGHVNPSVPCNAKCVNAIGPDCECSCGGANHGSGHLG